MSERRVAFATCRRLPDSGPDEELLRVALRARGVDARPAIWDDASVDWSSFALVIIRTTWDYSPRRDEFVEWARSVERATVIENPADVVQWNTHKSYLARLRAAGVPVPRTWLWPAGVALPPEISHEVRELRAERVIVKPAISASAVGVERFAADELAGAAAAGVDRIVQPFLERVETRGEISLVHVDGAFSHAVRKRPGDGDYRVQARLGGTWTPDVPTAAELAVARQALAALDAPPLYARVDLLEDDGGAPVVGELELVEPELFLRAEPASVARFAAAIDARLSRRS